MFSIGQLIFAFLFLIVFIVIIIGSYRKDKNLHKKHYKGSRWILVGFIIFIIFLFFLKGWLYE